MLGHEKTVVVAVHLTIPVLCLLRALLELSWGMNYYNPLRFLFLGPMLHSSLSTKSVTPCLWYTHNWSPGSWRKPSQKEERAPADRRSFWMLCQDASVDFHSVFYTPFLHSIPIHQDWTILPPCGVPRNSSLLYFIFFCCFCLFWFLPLPSQLSTIATLPKPYPSFPVSPSFLPSHLSHNSLYPSL